MKKFYAYDINGKVVLSTLCSNRVCAFDNVEIEEGDVAGAVKQLAEHGYNVNTSEIVFNYFGEETSKERKGKVGGITRVRT